MKQSVKSLRTLKEYYTVGKKGSTRFWFKLFEAFLKKIFFVLESRVKTEGSDA